MKRWLLSVLILSHCVTTLITPVSANDERSLLLTQMVVQSINSHHLKPQTIDDQYSYRVYALFIDRIDPNKQIFSQEQHRELIKHQHNIDNELSTGSFAFLNLSYSLYQSQLNKIEDIIKLSLKQDITMKDRDSIELDPKKRTITKNQEELEKRWSQFIRYDIIQNYIALYKKELKEQKKDPSNTDLIIDKKILKEARAKTKKSFQKRLKYMQSVSQKEFFNRYMDTLAQSHGPHSSYLPPAEKENFDIGMTGRLEGIGAVLREDDGFIKVVRIIPGSASWRQKELGAEDIILKVAQGKKDPVDLVELPVSEAVKYIRGKKGTEVRLTVRKPSGEEKVIPIIRDIVIVEETFAKAAIISDQAQTQKIGYAYLPGFYRDFKNKQERNASEDIEKILTQFNTAKVDGVILDLRNNGGGALEDAVITSGHFIATGPIVHVVNKNKQSRVLRDLNPKIAYDGPLIVMVNQFSASASEILAAALQDYDRAVIVGTKSSFGKGTVQAIINLDHYLPRKYSGLKPLGSMKMTIQKFFRVNGESTQVNGVVPDIILPSTMDHMTVGERTLDYSQPWNPVQRLSFKPWEQKPKIKALKKASAARQKKSPYFQHIKEYLSIVNEDKNQKQTLNAHYIWKEQQHLSKLNDEIDEITTALSSSNVFKVTSIVPNADQKDRQKEFEDGLKKDATLYEVLHIMKDMVNNNDT